MSTVIPSANKFMPSMPKQQANTQNSVGADNQEVRDTFRAENIAEKDIMPTSARSSLSTSDSSLHNYSYSYGDGNAGNNGALGGAPGTQQGSGNARNSIGSLNNNINSITSSLNHISNSLAAPPLFRMDESLHQPDSPQNLPQSQLPPSQLPPSQLPQSQLQQSQLQQSQLPQSQLQSHLPHSQLPHLAQNNLSHQLMPEIDPFTSPFEINSKIWGNDVSDGQRAAKDFRRNSVPATVDTSFAISPGRSSYPENRVPPFMLNSGATPAFYGGLQSQMSAQVPGPIFHQSSLGGNTDFSTSPVRESIWSEHRSSVGSIPATSPLTGLAALADRGAQQTRRIHLQAQAQAQAQAQTSPSAAADISGAAARSMLQSRSASESTTNALSGALAAGASGAPGAPGAPGALGAAPNTGLAYRRASYDAGMAQFLQMNASRLAAPIGGGRAPTSASVSGPVSGPVPGINAGAPPNAPALDYVKSFDNPLGSQQMHQKQQEEQLLNRFNSMRLDNYEDQYAQAYDEAEKYFKSPAPESLQLAKVLSYLNGPQLPNFSGGGLSDVQIVLVCFKNSRLDVFYVPSEAHQQMQGLKLGDLIIVEADRGRDLGKVVKLDVTLLEARLLKLKQFRDQQAALNQDHDNGNGEKRPTLHFPKPVVRFAYPNEVAELLLKKTDEERAKSVCQLKVKSHGLIMSITDSEYQWDRRKLTFYYKSNKRIDFRDLVKELFKIYKTRIWMCKQPEPIAGLNRGM